jgi:hypothetical protein
VRSGRPPPRRGTGSPRAASQREYSFPSASVSLADSGAHARSGGEQYIENTSFYRDVPDSASSPDAISDGSASGSPRPPRRSYSMSAAMGGVPLPGMTALPGSPLTKHTHAVKPLSSLTQQSDSSPSSGRPSAIDVDRAGLLSSDPTSPSRAAHNGAHESHSPSPTPSSICLSPLVTPARLVQQASGPHGLAHILDAGTSQSGAASPWSALSALSSASERPHSSAGLSRPGPGGGSALNSPPKQSEHMAGREDSVRTPPSAGARSSGGSVGAEFGFAFPSPAGRTQGDESAKSKGTDESFLGFKGTTPPSAHRRCERFHAVLATLLRALLELDAAVMVDTPAACDVLAQAFHLKSWWPHAFTHQLHQLRRCRVPARAAPATMGLLPSSTAWT